MMVMRGRLVKSGRNRILFGVAGGVAEYFRIDPAIVRALFILLAFANGIGVLIYLVLALVMARPEAALAEPLAVVKDNLRAAPRETRQAGRRVIEVLRGPAEGRSSTLTEPREDKSEGTPPQ